MNGASVRSCLDASLSALVLRLSRGFCPESSVFCLGSPLVTVVWPAAALSQGFDRLDRASLAVVRFGFCVLSRQRRKGACNWSIVV